MSALVSLEMLSTIKGAKSSEVVEKLFDVVRNATVGPEDNAFVDILSGCPVGVDDLREDRVVEASPVTKQIIIDNFPKQKNNYLAVKKVMDE